MNNTTEEIQSSTHDRNGNLDTNIRHFWIHENRVQCPKCEHCEPILTLAHLMGRHGVSIEEAKILRSSAKTVQPFKKRGEKLREQTKLANKDRQDWN